MRFQSLAVLRLHSPHWQSLERLTGHLQSVTLPKPFRLCLLVLAIGCSSQGPTRTLTVDFDSLSPGTVVTTMSDVSFGFNDPSVDLVVSTGLESTSSQNYLGAQGGLNDSFLPLDVLMLTFSVSVTHLSLAVISTPGTPGAALELWTPQGSMVTGAPDLILPTGDEVYLLSFRGGAAFQSAELRATEGLFAFNVDDVSYERADSDADGVPDDSDNCTAVANPLQIDTDTDPFGNACDCDFNQDDACSISDFNIFLPDFLSSTDSGVGTDMDGDGAVGIRDFNLFLPGFQAGAPGPSGLVP